jgi:hypothetical protein
LFGGLRSGFNAENAIGLAIGGSLASGACAVESTLLGAIGLGGQAPRFDSLFCPAGPPGAVPFPEEERALEATRRIATEPWRTKELRECVASATKFHSMDYWEPGTIGPGSSFLL